MIGVSDVMLGKLRESLRQAPAHSDGIIPVDEMSNHYCSLRELQDPKSYRQLFVVDVDGQQVFVYFKL